jgi:hypothetical protein
MFASFPKRAFPRRSFPTRKMGDTRAISDKEAHEFVLAAGITDENEKAAIYFLVYSLKVNNLWDRMVAIYPMVGGTALSCSLNLKNTALYQITWVNGPTFAATGVTGNGSNQYGNTHLVPSGATTYTNLHLSFYSRTDGSTGNLGALGGYNPSSLNGTALVTSGQGLFSSGVSPFYSVKNFATITTTNGLWLGVRDNTEISTYYKGVLKNNSSAYGTQPWLYVIHILALATNIGNSSAAFSNQECAFASIGGAMTEEEVTVFYAIIQEYQTMLSRQV